MKNIFIFEDNKELNIDFIQEDDVLVLHGDRNVLKQTIIPELDQPGVYFLLSENFIYIGQSGISVQKRFTQHLSERDWWTEFVVITDNKGELEKTMTEYIEEYFIKLLRRRGVNIDNDTLGNITPASRFTKIKINKIINISERIFNDFLDIDLFKEQKVSNINETPTHIKNILKDSNGNEFKGSSLYNSLSLLLINYAKDNYNYSKLAQAIDDEILTSDIVTTSESNYTKIADDIYLKKLDTKKTRSAIDYFAEILDININIKSI